MNDLMEVLKKHAMNLLDERKGFRGCKMS